MYDDFIESNVQTRENTNSLLNKVKPYVSTDKMDVVEEMLIVQPYYLDAYFDEIAKRYQKLGRICQSVRRNAGRNRKTEKNYLE